jgi:hypothetical protein
MFSKHSLSRPKKNNWGKKEKQKNFRSSFKNVNIHLEWGQNIRSNGSCFKNILPMPLLKVMKRFIA